MRPPVLCCLALALLPPGGCGESSPPPARQRGSADYRSLLRGATDELSRAVSVMRAVHSPGDLPGAREKLDAAAARIDALTEGLKTAERPDSAGYAALRPAADEFTAELKKLNEEERRAAAELGSQALDLSRTTLAVRGSLFTFQFQFDPMKGELDRMRAEQPPSPTPAAPQNLPPTRGPFGPSIPGGRSADPGQAAAQSLAAFRAKHPPGSIITVEVEGIPQQRLADLAWRLRALTGATLHAASGEGMRCTVLLYPVTDFGAAQRRIDLGVVTRADEAARTIYLTSDPSKLR